MEIRVAMGFIAVIALFLLAVYFTNLSFIIEMILEMVLAALSVSLAVISILIHENLFAVICRSLKSKIG